jgi:hypothetical protein
MLDLSIQNYIHLQIEKTMGRSNALSLSPVSFTKKTTTFLASAFAENVTKSTSAGSSGVGSKAVDFYFLVDLLESVPPQEDILLDDVQKYHFVLLKSIETHLLAALNDRDKLNWDCANAKSVAEAVVRLLVDIIDRAAKGWFGYYSSVVLQFVFKFVDFFNKTIITSSLSPEYQRSIEFRIVEPCKVLVLSVMFDQDTAAPPHERAATLSLLAHNGNVLLKSGSSRPPTHSVQVNSTLSFLNESKLKQSLKDRVQEHSGTNAVSVGQDGHISAVLVLPSLVTWQGSKSATVLNSAPASTIATMLATFDEEFVTGMVLLLLDWMLVENQDVAEAAMLLMSTLMKQRSVLLRSLLRESVPSGNAYKNIDLTTGGHTGGFGMLQEPRPSLHAFAAWLKEQRDDVVEIRAHAVIPKWNARVLLARLQDGLHTGGSSDMIPRTYLLRALCREHAKQEPKVLSVLLDDPLAFETAWWVAPRTQDRADGSSPPSTLGVPDWSVGQSIRFVTHVALKMQEKYRVKVASRYQVWTVTHKYDALHTARLWKSVKWRLCNPRNVWQRLDLWNLHLDPLAGQDAGGDGHGGGHGGGGGNGGGGDHHHHHHRDQGDFFRWLMLALGTHHHGKKTAWKLEDSVGPGPRRQRLRLVPNPDFHKYFKDMKKVPWKQQQETRTESLPAAGTESESEHVFDDDGGGVAAVAGEGSTNLMSSLLVKVTKVKDDVNDLEFDMDDEDDYASTFDANDSFVATDCSSFLGDEDGPGDESKGRGIVKADDSFVKGGDDVAGTTVVGTSNPAPSVEDGSSSSSSLMLGSIITASGNDHGGDPHTDETLWSSQHGNLKANPNP